MVALSACEQVNEGSIPDWLVFLQKQWFAGKVAINKEGLLRSIGDIQTAKELKAYKLNKAAGKLPWAVAHF